MHSLPPTATPVLWRHTQNHLRAGEVWWNRLSSGVLRTGISMITYTEGKQILLKVMGLGAKTQWLCMELTGKVSQYAETKFGRIVNTRYSFTGVMFTHRSCYYRFNPAHWAVLKGLKGDGQVS